MWFSDLLQHGKPVEVLDKMTLCLVRVLEVPVHRKMIVRILICVGLEPVFLFIYYIVWAGFMMFFAVIQSNLFGLPPFQQ